MQQREMLCGSFLLQTPRSALLLRVIRLQGGEGTGLLACVIFSSPPKSGTAVIIVQSGCVAPTLNLEGLILKDQEPHEKISRGSKREMTGQETREDTRHGVLAEIRVQK